MGDDFHSAERGSSGSANRRATDFDPPPQPRRFPAERVIRWIPVRSRARGDAEPTVTIVFEQPALHAVGAHARATRKGAAEGAPEGRAAEAAAEGAAGLLTGDLYRCPATGRLWVAVEGATPAMTPLPDDSDLAAFDRAVTPLIRESALRGQRAVGWYHVHTALGMFLSGGEAEAHAARFGEPWQLALVLLVDPQRPAGGVFLRSEAGELSRSGYVAFHELLHHSSLLPGGRKRTFVGWGNHAPDQPAVLAGTQGAPLELPESRPAAMPAPTPTVPSAPLAGSQPAPPGAAGGDERADSDAEYDRIRMKRALSAVDFTLTPLPATPPAERSAQRSGHGGISVSGNAGPAAAARSESAAGHVSGPQRGSASVLTSPGQPAIQAEAGSRWRRRRRPGMLARRVGWAVLGLLLISLLVWYLSRLGVLPAATRAEDAAADSSAGPALPESPPERGDVRPAARAPEVGRSTATASGGALAGTAASLGARARAGAQRQAVGTPHDAVLVPPARSALAFAAPAPPRGDPAEALAVFWTESEGYLSRSDGFALDRVGCNELHSWYRSVGEAYERLSALHQAAPPPDPDWQPEYRQASATIGAIGRDYASTGCPLPSLVRP